MDACLEILHVLTCYTTDMPWQLIIAKRVAGFCPSRAARRARTGHEEAGRKLAELQGTKKPNMFLPMLAKPSHLFKSKGSVIHEPIYHSCVLL